MILPQKPTPATPARYKFFCFSVGPLCFPPTPPTSTPTPTPKTGCHRLLLLECEQWRREERVDSLREDFRGRVGIICASWYLCFLDCCLRAIQLPLEGLKVNKKNQLVSTDYLLTNQLNKFKNFKNLEFHFSSKFQNLI